MAVTFKVYQSNGITLVATLPVVFSANYPQSEKNIIEHINPRGKGSLIMDTGDAPWNLIIKGVLQADDYDSLMALVNTLENAIALNTPYILKITKSAAGGTTWDYHVKRVLPIEYPEDSLRTDFLEYTITFRVNSWG